jgi:hypothetical protein
VLAGVISLAEKSVYRCDDSPKDREQLPGEVVFASSKKALKRIDRGDSLLHGVRSSCDVWYQTKKRALGHGRHFPPRAI